MFLSCYIKDTVYRIKSHNTRDNVCKSDTRVMICIQYMQRILNLNNKKTKHLTEKWVKEMHTHSTKGDTQMANKFMKRGLPYFLIRKFQITDTIR